MSDLHPDDPCSCDGGIEGVHEDCCLHDLRRGEGLPPERPRDGFGQICCWCGNLYLSRQDGGGHGEYEPGIAPSVKKKREATGRKEERIRVKEEAQYREDYGVT